MNLSKGHTSVKKKVSSILTTTVLTWKPLQMLLLIKPTAPYFSSHKFVNRICVRKKNLSPTLIHQYEPRTFANPAPTITKNDHITPTLLRLKSPKTHSSRTTTQKPEEKPATLHLHLPSIHLQQSSLWNSVAPQSLEISLLQRWNNIVRNGGWSL